MRMNLFSKWNLDAVGIGASLACAGHCALLPLLITAMPLLGLEVLENDRLEFLLLGVSFIIGYAALFRGYRRYHRHFWPLLWFTLGFGGLLAGHFLVPEGLEAAVIATGALLIIVAHMLNLQGCRRCRVVKKEKGRMAA